MISLSLLDPAAACGRPPSPAVRGIRARLRARAVAPGYVVKLAAALVLAAALLPVAAPIPVRATSGYWRTGQQTEAARVIADARQHLGQHPYDNGNAGWDRLNSINTGRQVMDAQAPWINPSYRRGLDCVGFIYVVFTETGHNGATTGTSPEIGQGHFSHVVLNSGTKDVPSYYAYFKNTPAAGVTLTDLSTAANGYNFSERDLTDSYASPGDIVIFKYNDGKAADGTNLAHVAIYEGNRWIIHMSSDQVGEVDLSNTWVGPTPTNHYSVAAVVHTGLNYLAESDRIPDPPLAMANMILDVTGIYTDDHTGSRYQPITPFRLMDTRTGGHVGTATTFTSRTPQNVEVWGQHGIQANAIAVTGNVTVVGAQGSGHVTVAPGYTLYTDREPATSTLNFPANDTRANAVVMGLDPTGALAFMYWSTNKTYKADLIFDVTGYYTDDDTGFTYVPLTAPGRLMDTRFGTAATTFVSRTPKHIQIAGVPLPSGDEVPLDAQAVTGNVTVTNQKNGSGHVTVAPGGTLQAAVNPPTSTLNFPRYDNRANAIVVALPQGGQYKGMLDFMYWSSNSTYTADLIFDVSGYYITDPTGIMGMKWKALNPPVRVFDTRKEPNAYLLNKTKQTRQVWGGQVSANAAAITGNVTAVNQACYGWMVVTPGGILQSGDAPGMSRDPGYSTLNFPNDDARANAVFVRLSSTGAIDVMYWWGDRNRCVPVIPAY